MGDANLTRGADFFWSGLAGSVARASAHGPSVIKIRQEAGLVGARTGPFRAMINLWSTNGFWGFVTGEGTAVVRAFPHYGIALTMNERLHDVYYNRKMPPMSIVNLTATYSAGAVSGMAATLVTHPLDLIKTRLILHQGQYAGGPFGVFLHSLKNDGIYRGIYRGLGISMIGASVFWGSAMTGIHMTQQVGWVRRKPIIPYIEWLVWPTVAVVGAAIVSMPFDVVRRKYMCQNLALPKQGGCDVTFRTLPELVVATWRQGGPYAFYQGAMANATKMVPQFILFLAVFKGKDMLMPSSSSSVAS